MSVVVQLGWRDALRSKLGRFRKREPLPASDVVASNELAGQTDDDRIEPP